MQCTTLKNLQRHRSWECFGAPGLGTPGLATPDLATLTAVHVTWNDAYTRLLYNRWSVQSVGRQQTTFSLSSPSPIVWGNSIQDSNLHVYRETINEVIVYRWQMTTKPAPCAHGKSCSWRIPPCTTPSDTEVPSCFTREWWWGVGWQGLWNDKKSPSCQLRNLIWNKLKERGGEKKKSAGRFLSHWGGNSRSLQPRMALLLWD